MDAPAPPPWLVSRVERLTRRRIVDARRPSGGYTSVERWSLRFDDGTAAFVKAGRDAETSRFATWLREEHRWYQWLGESGASFAPAELAWEDGEPAVLLLEDLSAAHWPPPWREGDLARAREALQALAVHEPPPWAPALEYRIHGLGRGWDEVAADPRPFLSLGLASERWLTEALEPLRAASRDARLDGPSLVHADFRSDNVCIGEDGRMRIVDWNWAARGNAAFDAYGWLPALALEGGPKPWEVAPGGGAWAALLGGYFASRAGLPDIPTAPTVRAFQRAQLEVCLEWAAEELGVPAPSGAESGS